MSFRKFLFWTHLVAGSVAGIVILVMSVTGVLLAYERQITGWVDRGFRSTIPAPGTPRMAAGTLMDRATAILSAPPQSVTVHADPSLPVEISPVRDRVLYFDVFTGRELGEGSQRARRFFSAVESLHRWLGVGEKNRALGRAITGASNLAFLVLIVTGLYLWWPRALSWRQFKTATTPRLDLPAGRARHWNWHTVGGFWLATPLLVIVLCGVVISYPWANNLLYRITGNSPPPPGRGTSATMALAPNQRLRGEGPPHASEEGRKDRREDSAGLNPDHERKKFDPDRANRNWELAESQVSGWKSITLRRAQGERGQEVFLIDRGDGGRPDLRSQLVVNAKTGEVVRSESFSSYNQGRRWRMWARFLHTGEAGGWLGQTIAALAATMASLLVYTGLAMAWRRAGVWLAQKSSSSASILAEATSADEFGEAGLVATGADNEELGMREVS